MKRYTVEHKCGHGQKHAIVGGGIDRDRDLAWLATLTCSACRRIAEDAATAQDDRSPSLDAISREAR